MARFTSSPSEMFLLTFFVLLQHVWWCSICSSCNKFQSDDLPPPPQQCLQVARYYRRGNRQTVLYCRTALFGTAPAFGMCCTVSLVIVLSWVAVIGGTDCCDQPRGEKACTSQCGALRSWLCSKTCPGKEQPRGAVAQAHPTLLLPLLLHGWCASVCSHSLPAGYQDLEWLKREILIVYSKVLLFSHFL